MVRVYLAGFLAVLASAHVVLAAGPGVDIKIRAPLPPPPPGINVQIGTQAPDRVVERERVVVKEHGKKNRGKHKGHHKKKKHGKHRD